MSLLDQGMVEPLEGIRRPHEPNDIVSGLLAAEHKDRHSAALSIVSNRASKIDLLLSRGCTNLARNSADSLVHDVLEHIANGDLLTNSRLAQDLANAAIYARDRCYTA